jgi:hypothetical protein
VTNRAEAAAVMETDAITAMTNVVAHPLRRFIITLSSPCREQKTLAEMMNVFQQGSFTNTLWLTKEKLL